MKYFKRLRVLVVDDHGLVRAELADALARAATTARGVGVEVWCSAEVFVVAEVDVALAHDCFSSLTSAAAAGTSDLRSFRLDRRGPIARFDGLVDLVTEIALAVTRTLDFGCVDQAERLLARLFFLVFREEPRCEQNFTSSGSMVTLSTATSSRRRTVWNLSTVSSMRRLRSSSVTTRAAAEVLEVVVNAPPLLGHEVRQLAATPRLDLHEGALFAAHDFGHAIGHLVGRVGVDVLPQDVDGFVFSGAILRHCFGCHFDTSPSGLRPRGRLARSKEPPGTMPDGPSKPALS